MLSAVNHSLESIYYHPTEAGKRKRQLLNLPRETAESLRAAFNCNFGNAAFTGNASTMSNYGIAGFQSDPESQKLFQDLRGKMQLKGYINNPLVNVSQIGNTAVSQGINQFAGSGGSIRDNVSRAGPTMPFPIVNELTGPYGDAKIGLVPFNTQLDPKDPLSVQFAMSLFDPESALAIANQQQQARLKQGVLIARHGLQQRRELERQAQVQRDALRDYEIHNQAPPPGRNGRPGANGGGPGTGGGDSSDDDSQGGGGGGGRRGTGSGGTTNRTPFASASRAVPTTMHTPARAPPTVQLGNDGGNAHSVHSGTGDGLLENATTVSRGLTAAPSTIIAQSYNTGNTVISGPRGEPGQTYNGSAQNLSLTSTRTPLSRGEAIRSLSTNPSILSNGELHREAQSRWSDFSPLTIEGAESHSHTSYLFRPISTLATSPVESIDVSSFRSSGSYSNPTTTTGRNQFRLNITAEGSAFNNARRNDQSFNSGGGMTGASPLVGVDESLPSTRASTASRGGQIIATQVTSTSNSSASLGQDFISPILTRRGTVAGDASRRVLRPKNGPVSLRRPPDTTYVMKSPKPKVVSSSSAVPVSNPTGKWRRRLNDKKR